MCIRDRYITYCVLVLGYTCVNIPYGTLCGTLTQNIEERAKINTSRSVCAMVAINIINIITLPLISAFGGDNAARGYLLVTVLYGGIFTLCHWFCFAKTKEVVQPPERKKVSLKKQLDAALQNKPYLIALAGQFLFGVTLYGRNADLLYYFKYVEGNENLFTIYSMILIVPSILGAAAFPFVFEKLGNKGHTASLFAAGTGVSLIALYFFSAVSSPIPFYTFAALSQFFFCGFNTAIYAIVPDLSLIHISLDIALWDIKGKALGVPIYQLLGGKCRDELRCYASQLQFGWTTKIGPWGSDKEYVDIVRHAVSEGYDAVKIDFTTYDENAKKIPHLSKEGFPDRSLYRCV